MNKQKQKQTKKYREPVAARGDGEIGEIGERDSEVQISSYKISHGDKN